MNLEDFVISLKEKGFVVLAGTKGLKKSVVSINMMENPDTLKWVKPGEILLTTGYFMKDDEDIQLNFIRELSEIGAAGIGIKKNRYILKLYEKVLEEADGLALPIIEIPYEFSLADVSSMFYKELYERQSQRLRRSFDIHEEFMNIVIRGGSINELTDELGNVIDNPVLVTDEQGEIISNKNFQHTKYYIKDLFINVNNDFVLNTESLKKYYNDDELPREAIKFISTIEGEEVSFRIKPIVSDKEIHGYIIVPEINRKMIELDYIAIERALIIIMLERMKEKAVDEAKHLMRRDFFDELIEGKIPSEDEMENLAMMYGLTPLYKYSCMVLELKDLHNIKGNYLEINLIRQLKDELIKTIDEISLKEKINTISITRSAYVIAFIPIKTSENPKDIRDFMVTLGKDIIEEFLRKYNNYSITIGVGKAYKIVNLSKSFKEAMESNKMIGKLNNKDKVVHFDDFMIYHLLNSTGNTDLLKEFYNSSIRKLAEYDEENKTNLIETLEIYFKCKGNMSEAAKTMYIHRNTLLYRLDKIKEILNTDLENGDENLEFQLGIHIMKLLFVYNGETM
ncbi:MAG: PucR family transcriptional regulator ligand-binding domain-containing protein [Clostridiaceae bacterium]